MFTKTFLFIKLFICLAPLLQEIGISLNLARYVLFLPHQNFSFILLICFCPYSVSCAVIDSTYSLNLCLTR